MWCQIEHVRQDVNVKRLELRLHNVVNTTEHVACINFVRVLLFSRYGCSCQKPTTNFATRRKMSCESVCIFDV